MDFSKPIMFKAERNFQVTCLHFLKPISRGKTISLSISFLGFEKASLLNFPFNKHLRLNTERQRSSRA